MQMTNGSLIRVIAGEKKWPGLRGIFKVQPIWFVDRLIVGYKRERSKVTALFLVWITAKIDLPLADVGKEIGWA